jgi:ATP-dependent DNA helicase 2 subunit 2
LEPDAVDKADKQLPTPAPDSDIELEDEGSLSDNRIISHSRPLADFRKNMKTGDLVSKAVEDLSWVVKDVVMKPFASRRQAEMIDCMKELREACLTEDEIDAWNA